MKIQRHAEPLTKSISKSITFVFSQNTEVYTRGKLRKRRASLKWNNLFVIIHPGSSKYIKMKIKILLRKDDETSSFSWKPMHRFSCSLHLLHVHRCFLHTLLLSLTPICTSPFKPLISVKKILNNLCCLLHCHIMRGLVCLKKCFLYDGGDICSRLLWWLHIF